MRRPRAMILDDEPTIVTAMRRYFIRRGYEVLCFTDPVVCPLYEGSARCDKKHPCADVVLTDLKMPRMTGIELLELQSQRGCKADMRNKAIMSAYFDEGVLERIRALGCSYFNKPFELSELSDWLGRIEKRIDLSRPLGILK
ncbi:MAG: response regulator [Nitrospirae bacterium]|nr:response regulator [Nitrospirota bacterium]